jgi:hypothetical protein
MVRYFAAATTLGMAIMAVVSHEEEDRPRGAAGLSAKSVISLTEDPVGEIYKQGMRIAADIEERALVDGMVINLINDVPVDFCDSLLFSSLRVAGLRFLGANDQADEALAALRKSEFAPGEWRRHPRCGKTLSRDMTLGLTILMVLDPSGMHDEYLRLMDYVRRSKGFVSHTVSFTGLLNPEHGLRFAHIGRLLGVAEQDLPLAARFGMSRMSWSSTPSGVGYTRHLDGLLLFADLLLWQKGITPPENAHELAARLARGNPDNLFFVFLDKAYRGAGYLSASDRRALAELLLASPYFPDEGLPNSCHRFADYLWQRSFADYRILDQSCSKTFSGVDYLFLSGLIAGWP